MKGVLVAGLVVWLPKENVVSDSGILYPGLLGHVRYLTLREERENKRENERALTVHTWSETVPDIFSISPKRACTKEDLPAPT